MTDSIEGVGEPYGYVTVVRRPNGVKQHWFYRLGETPYLDNAAECHTVYSESQLAGVIAAEREKVTKLREALTWALEWIDAVPPETVLPTMPGFDRDYVDTLLGETGQ